ncbi:MAG: hypothetical protein ACE5Q6_01885 [Dehalococcoidia bacterium]
MSKLQLRLRIQAERVKKILCTWAAVILAGGMLTFLVLFLIPYFQDPDPPIQCSAHLIVDGISEESPAIIVQGEATITNFAVRLRDQNGNKLAVDEHLWEWYPPNENPLAKDYGGDAWPYTWPSAGSNLQLVWVKMTAGECTQTAFIVLKKAIPVSN